MSITLTTTNDRPVIDLTGESPPGSAASAAPKSYAPPVATGRTDRSRVSKAGEPPAKRRKHSEGTDRHRRSLANCIQEQILPHVVRAVSNLSNEHYQVDAIAIQTVAKLARSSEFRIALDEAGSIPPTLAKAEAERLAVSVVNKLKILPEYQVPKSDRLEHNRTLLKIEPHVPQPPTPKPLTTQPPTGRVTRPRLAHKPNAPALVSAQQNRVAPQDKPRPQPVQRRRDEPRGVALGPGHTGSKWFRLKTRPYMPAEERMLIARGLKRPISSRHDTVQWPLVYHVDFSPDEVAQISAHLAKSFSVNVPRSLADLANLCYQHNVASLVGNAIPGRTAEDLRHFCSDLMAGQAADPTNIRVLSLEKATKDLKRQDQRVNRIPSLLFAREMEGNAGFGRMRRYVNFQNEFKKAYEDGLTIIAEFTNCAGDISAMSWIPDENILCGTTAHSDAHNQQYNKPGNLLLCSASQGKLRAFADHRIPRPLVEKGENSTDAMRRSQDPWLYSSVVSSDYDEVHKRAFTSSFDKTVKVWNVSKDGSHMEAIATWHHEGNVNFVATAKDGSGRVASAADVPIGAIRVYTIRSSPHGDGAEDISNSPYTAISCTRTDANDSDKWAYFPATMQWGRAPGTTHILAVGYSPRSLTNDDRDIPEDKKDSGEILLWDAANNCRLSVLTASTANVFEIAWHPTIPRFVVATSPSGLTIEHGVRTHIHIFQRDIERKDDAYHEVQSLDCPAADVNELTIVPNSPLGAYVTAACTDGKVYVWDTAQGDYPIHVLKHGYPLDDFTYDREKEDTGVKFTAWGTTPDRFYTGSSDGVVKVWNVRNRRKPFIRDLLEAPAPISIGAFSPDHSKLAIGDATGRVFLFSIDERDKREEHFMTIPGTNRKIRRPTPFIPHPEPPPPSSDDSHRMNIDGESKPSIDEDTSIAAYAKHTFLDSKQLVLHPNPVIGAVQGPEYPSTGLYRREAHLDDDPLAPLLASYTKHEPFRLTRQRSLLRLRNPFAAPDYAPDAVEASEVQSQKRVAQHTANRKLDVEGLELDFADLWKELQDERAVLADAEEDWGFVYEDDGFIEINCKDLS